MLANQKRGTAGEGGSPFPGRFPGSIPRGRFPGALPGVPLSGSMGRTPSWRPPRWPPQPLPSTFLQPAPRPGKRDLNSVFFNGSNLRTIRRSWSGLVARKATFDHPFRNAPTRQLFEGPYEMFLFAFNFRIALCHCSHHLLSFFFLPYYIRLGHS